MENNQLTELLKLQDISGGTIGEFAGYYCSVGEGREGMLNGTFINFSFKKRVTVSDLRAATKGLRGFTVILRKFIEEGDTVSIFLPKKINEEKLSNFLTQLTNNFKLHGFVQHETCPTCKEEADIIIRRGFAIRMHTECLEEYNVTINRANAELGTGSVAKSIVFSIFGAIIGAIPSIILMFAANYMLTLIFALIPLGAYYGYKIGKAKVGKLSIAIFIVISLVLSISSLFLYTSVLLKQEGVTFSFAWEILPEFRSAFMQDAFKVVLFTMLGILITWGVITKDNKQKTI